MGNPRTLTGPPTVPPLVTLYLKLRCDTPKRVIWPLWKGLLWELPFGGTLGREASLERGWTVTYKMCEELVTDVAMHLLELLQVVVAPLHAQIPHAHGGHHFHTCRLLEPWERHE